MFSTRSMIATLYELKPPPLVLLNAFAQEVNEATSDVIDLDIVVRTRRMAPYVAATLPAKVVKSEGFTTQTIRPPYIQDLRVCQAADMLRRSAGTNMYDAGQQSLLERGQDKLTEELANQQDMVNRREEWQLAQLMVDGTVDLVGEGVNQTVDFGMPAANQITLTGPDLWTDQTNSNPLKDLIQWGRIVAQATALSLNRIYLGSAAADAFVTHPKVIEATDTRRNENRAVARQVVDGERYLGYYEGVDVFGYDAWYEQDDGSGEAPMIPADRALGGATSARTIRHYGAIVDFEAGVTPTRWFPKTWVTKNPSVMNQLLQSAPMVGMHQPGAFISAKVV